MRRITKSPHEYRGDMRDAYNAGVEAGLKEATAAAAQEIAAMISEIRDIYRRSNPPPPGIDSPLRNALFIAQKHARWMMEDLDNLKYQWI